MTVIAYDGKTLAVDRRCVAGDRFFPGTKFTLWKGHVFLYCGTRSAAEQVTRWAMSGRRANRWPACQSTDDFAVVVFGKPDGTVARYERYPIELAELAQIVAYGTGAEAAMGAMHNGADAAAAVYAAARVSFTCGDGVDGFTYDSVAKKWVHSLATEIIQVVCPRV